MAINNNTAEEQARPAPSIETATDAFNRATDTLAGTSPVDAVSNLIRIAPDALLNRLVTEVDNPILKDLMRDMTNLLSSMYGSPDTLCCLIKNIFLSVAGANDIENYKKLQETLRGSDGDKENLSSLNPFASGSAGDSLDSLIFIIDAIILFLEMDIKDFVFPSLDFSAMLMESVMSALMMVLQEIIFTLRDTAINWILQTVQDNLGNSPALKCLPFMDLIRFIRTYLHDYGVTGKFFNWFKKLIDGFISNRKLKWQNVVDQDIIDRTKVLDFLKSVRSLLVQLKSATLDIFMCIDVDDQLPDQGLTPSETGENDPWFGLFKGMPSDNNNQNGSLSNLNAIVGDNGTILRDSSGASTGAGNQSPYSAPSNNEISNFLQKQLGLSPELANQLTGFTSSLDNIQGTLSDNPHIAGRDCGYILNIKELASAVQDVSRRFGIK